MRRRPHRDPRTGLLQDTGLIHFENGFGQERNRDTGGEQESADDTDEEDDERTRRPRARRPPPPHHAIDIYAAFGCPIHVAATATVVESFRVGQDPRPGVGPDPHATGRSGGNYLMLLDRQGRHHYYAHMVSPARFSSGDVLPAGTRIGGVGASGLRSFHVQHLHYQVTVRPVPGRLRFINPYNELVRLIRLLSLGRENVTNHYSAYTLHPPGGIRGEPNYTGRRGTRPTR